MNPLERKRRLAIEPFEPRQVLSASPLEFVAGPMLAEHPLTGEPHVVVAKTWLDEAGVSKAAALIDPTTGPGAVIASVQHALGTGLTPIDRSSNLATIPSQAVVESFAVAPATVLEEYRLDSVTTVYYDADDLGSSFDVVRSELQFDPPFSRFDFGPDLEHSTDLLIEGEPIAYAEALRASAGVTFEAMDLPTGDQAFGPLPVVDLVGVDYAAAIEDSTPQGTLFEPTVAQQEPRALAIDPQASTPSSSSASDPFISSLASEVAAGSDEVETSEASLQDDWFAPLSEESPTVSTESYAEETPDGSPPRVTHAAREETPSLQRITVGVPGSRDGAGAIDLAALLTPKSSSGEVVPVASTVEAADEYAARDAAFAVESWVRTLPTAEVGATRRQLDGGQATTKESTPPRYAPVRPADGRAVSVERSESPRRGGIADTISAVQPPRSAMASGLSIAALLSGSIVWGRWRRPTAADPGESAPPRPDRGSDANA